jgi:hypothetical protein
MSLTIEVRRQLLSSANMWLGQVELLNSRAIHAHVAFATRQSAGGPPSEQARHFETCLLASLRGLFGETIGGLLFTELSYMTVADVHLVTLALEHAYQAVIKVKADLSPDCHDSANRFERAWASVSDVRDLLEHEEEYLVGKGRFPQKADPNWMPPAMGMSRPLQLTDSGIAAIQVLGKWYDVRETIAAALALKAILLEETSKIAPKAQ